MQPLVKHFENLYSPQMVEMTNNKQNDNLKNYMKNTFFFVKHFNCVILLAKTVCDQGSPSLPDFASGNKGERVRE